MHRKLSLSVALTGLLLSGLADASVQTRERRSVHNALQPRIVSAYTEGEQLIVAGQNLPSGEDVLVQLGDHSLEVLVSSQALLVARLPTGEWQNSDALTIQAGVRRAQVDGRALHWGLRLPNLFR